MLAMSLWIAFKKTTANRWSHSILLPCWFMLQRQAPGPSVAIDWCSNWLWALQCWIRLKDVELFFKNVSPIKLTICHLNTTLYCGQRISTLNYYNSVAFNLKESNITHKNKSQICTSDCQGWRPGPPVLRWDSVVGQIWISPAHRKSFSRARVSVCAGMCVSVYCGRLTGAAMWPEVRHTALCSQHVPFCWFFFCQVDGAPRQTWISTAHRCRLPAFPPPPQEHAHPETKGRQGQSGTVGSLSVDR